MPASLFDRKLSKDERVVHALNRLSYGPRPGDIERVKAVGREKWIDEQLYPERIAENPLLESRLAPLDSLRMSTEEMIERYPPPQLLKARKGPGGTPHKPDLGGLLTPGQWRQLRAGSIEERAALLRSLEPDKLSQLVDALPTGLRRGLYAVAPAEVRRKMLAAAAPIQVVASDLVESKLYRAIYSNRQLEEVLVDFWFNHFNVYMNKGPNRSLVISYERDAIRPHVLGKFRDMLIATAQHPAMLIYLDNWQSIDPNSIQRPGRFSQALSRRARGLNENYGRELLELHTLGVDGGYTQQDVVEVARCLTGWTIRDPRRGGGFQFAERVHDPGEKTVLGVKIPARGGMEDGLKVIDILVQHPSTARFISMKLAQRFVADNPPAALVERMAAAFRKTGGGLRAITKTMIQSREFFSRGAWQGKTKSPLEMVVSSVRALDAEVTFAGMLAVQIERLGQPLYRKEEPTGYSNAGEEWINSAGLLGRMNFAVALVGNKLPGVKVNLVQLEGKPAGLVLGSPEFQRR